MIENVGGPSCRSREADCPQDGPTRKVGKRLHEIYLIDPDVVVGLKHAALAARQPDVPAKWELIQLKKKSLAPVSITH